MEAENRFHQETAEVIRRFIDNSGHFDGKEEAEYGEPFYGHEMRNHILDHFTLYDEVAVNYIDSRKEEKTEGIILRIFFSGIVVGTAVRKGIIWKGKNIFIHYEEILSINLKKMENKIAYANLMLCKKSLEQTLPKQLSGNQGQIETYLKRDIFKRNDIDREGTRDNLKKYFEKVFPQIPFEQSIVITGTYALYWPFQQEGVSCKTYLSTDKERKDKPVKLKTEVIKEGDFFCVKNIGHEGQFKNKMVMHLTNQDYSNVTISFLWTVDCRDDNGKPVKMQMVNVVRADRVSKTEPGRNVYDFTAVTAPYIGIFKSELERKNPKVLEYLMTQDCYMILLPESANGYVVKYPDGDSSARLRENSRLSRYMDTATMTYLEFDKNSAKRHDRKGISPVVEVECERNFIPESGTGNSDFFDFQSGTW